MVWSDAELESLENNLTPQQIGLYREFRAAVDKRARPTWLSATWCALPPRRGADPQW